MNGIKACICCALILVGNIVEAADSDRTTSNDTALGEIIVTAQKRDERLQDVPIPVTVVSVENLVNTNQVRLQDYYTQVPGLTLVSGGGIGGGAPVLSIRGISTGQFGNPTVGTVVDEVPYGSSNFNGVGFNRPDVDPSDAADVEVLRGPQGTLYGSSSIGGLIKYDTINPTTDKVSGLIQAGTDAIYNGTGVGYSTRAAVNVPLSDTWAVRVSGFARRDPGYIDDPVLHEDGINRRDTQGGRVTALWTPEANVSLKLGAVFQHSEAAKGDQVDLLPGFGDLNATSAPGTNWFATNNAIFSANLKAKLGRFDFASITGYGTNEFSDSVDLTTSAPFLAMASEQFYGSPGTQITDHARNNKISQEFRLSTTFASHVDAVVGLFYTHEKSLWQEYLLASDITTGTILGQQYSDPNRSTFEEYAAFTDETIHFTDQFDIQLGARESGNVIGYQEQLTGPQIEFLYGVPAVIQPHLTTHDDSFTYLVAPEFKINPDLMVYARLASGYRAGGPNSLSSFFDAPRYYQPDKTQNYEIGTKGNLLGPALTIDASLYYITWQDIQLGVTDPRTGFGYFSNGSRAKSEGLELSLVSRPITGLMLSGWIALNDAVLTQNIPPPSVSGVYGVEGDRLPFSSRFSGSLSGEYDFPLTANLTGLVGASVNYVGDRAGAFQTTAFRFDMPAYAKTDMRAGFKRSLWSADFYVNNLADKRGVLLPPSVAAPPYGYYYITPRTVGFSVTRTF